jgi:hypothetical protein
MESIDGGRCLNFAATTLEVVYFRYPFFIIKCETGVQPTHRALCPIPGKGTQGARTTAVDQGIILVFDERTEAAGNAFTKCAPIDEQQTIIPLHL